ncbi:DUF2461 domain-containing protein [Breznakiella homolactica]|uniref:DUF2461 domain-containing protein n=1 Tax=Breznakiella homolactica TaxID=2798577 RepID=A0A7T8B9R5_9SPIR|nr:DUF2461 domain-containing protein [Breznakiella homolactica]QQO08762.1 DUF2461 domain-containing protein [Breznakiella homolactica]
MALSQKTLEFLFQNRMEDSRDWFNEHRGEYREYVLEPLAQLVTDLTPGMLEIDPLFITEPKVDRCISRIHRDVRFSRDKSLYRENCWILFIRDKKLYNGLPAFYFEVNPANFIYGMGYYQASTASMQAIRKLIIAGTPAFKNAFEAYKTQDTFHIEGDRYKRSKYPDQPEELREWLDRKGLSFNASCADKKLLFSDSLSSFLLEGFRKLAPVYHFLFSAEDWKEG